MTQVSETIGRAWCVICRRGEPDSELLAALQRRHLEIVDCLSPARAMAELCRLEKTPSITKPVALLLVEPTSLPGARELVEAVDRYVPHTHCWVFDSAGDERLRGLTPEELAGWSPVRDRRAPESTSGPAGPETAPAADPIENFETIRSRPRLRLAGDGPIGEPLIVSPVEEMVSEAQGEVAQSVETRHLLSDEELAMLLAVEPERKDT